LFHLLGETGIGAGVRRVEAVTGRGVLEVVATATAQVRATADAMRARPEELVERAQEVVARLQRRDKEVAQLSRAQTLGHSERLAREAATVPAAGGDFRIATGVLPEAGVEELRALADDLRERLGTGGVLLAGGGGERGVLLCALSRDLPGRGLHAGKVIAAAAAAAGGRGGGRPDLAHAGLPSMDHAAEALEAGLAALKEQARR
jgi:alanyl-tRNA synthetase